MNLFNQYISFYTRMQKIKKEHGYFFATFFIVKIIYRKLIRISVIPVAALIVCLRPWVKIRFIPVSCLTIGHYAVCPEILLCEIDLNKNNKCDEKIIFLQRPKSEVCNVQLYQMWKRIIPFSPDVLFLLCAQIESRLEHWFGIHPYKIILGHGSCDRWGVLERSHQHLHFTKDELLQGERVLATMGIPAHTRFVCLLARDEAYYATKDAIYNSMSSYRNADILTYKKAALFLADNGYYVIRMGKKVSKRFDLNHEKVIDYAASHFRSDFMDIYLSAHCYFFISTLCGLDGVAHAFRRPILATNVTPNGYPYIGYPVKLFLIKKIINKNTGQILSFKQLNKVFHFDTTHEFIHKMMDTYCLKMIDNTEDEILEATKEMVLRMQGDWRETELSEVFHKKLWSEMTHHVSEEMVEKLPLHKHPCKHQARYCMADLLNNRSLLENI